MRTVLLTSAKPKLARLLVALTLLGQVLAFTGYVPPAFARQLAVEHTELLADPPGFRETTTLPTTETAFVQAQISKNSSASTCLAQLSQLHGQLLTNYFRAQPTPVHFPLVVKQFRPNRSLSRGDTDDCLLSA